jgi:hypothetical protein
MEFFGGCQASESVVATNRAVLAYETTTFLELTIVLL